MKRLIALVLCLALALSLAACGKKEENPSSTNSQTSTVQQENSESGSSGTNGQATTIQRENGEVILTMSKDMLEIAGISADDMLASTNDADRITKNDDGSVTCKITEDEYNQLLSTLKETIDETIQAIKDDETIAGCVKDITYTDDVGEIVVTAEKEAFENSITAAMIAPTLGLYGMMYQMYTGVPSEEIKCTVAVKDSSTGEEFQSVTYPDAIEEAASGATVSQ